MTQCSAMPIHSSGGDWGQSEGCLGQQILMRQGCFTPGNTKGSRGWRLWNCNISVTGRWAEAGKVLHRYVEIPACTYFQNSHFLFSFGVLRGKDPHRHSFAYAALCNHFMAPSDTCIFNSLLAHRMQTSECIAGEIFLFLFINH